MALGALAMFVFGGLVSLGVNAVDADPRVAALAYVGVAAVGGIGAAQLVLRSSRRDPPA